MLKPRGPGARSTTAPSALPSGQHGSVAQSGLDVPDAPLTHASVHASAHDASRLPARGEAEADAVRPSYAAPRPASGQPEQRGQCEQEQERNQGCQAARQPMNASPAPTPPITAPARKQAEPDRLR